MRLTAIGVFFLIGIPGFRSGTLDLANMITGMDRDNGGQSGKVATLDVPMTSSNLAVSVKTMEEMDMTTGYQKSLSDENSDNEQMASDGFDQDSSHDLVKEAKVEKYSNESRGSVNETAVIPEVINCVFCQKGFQRYIEEKYQIYPNWSNGVERFNAMVVDYLKGEEAKQHLMKNFEQSEMLKDRVYIPSLVVSISLFLLTLFPAVLAQLTIIVKWYRIRKLPDDDHHHHEATARSRSHSVAFNPSTLRRNSEISKASVDDTLEISHSRSQATAVDCEQIELECIQTTISNKIERSGTIRTLPEELTDGLEESDDRSAGEKTKKHVCWDTSVSMK